MATVIVIPTYIWPWPWWASTSTDTDNRSQVQVTDMLGLAPLCKGAVVTSNRS